jgi:hypothetical protein
MKLSSFAKYGLSVTTGAAMLAACSNNGGSSLAPSGASSGMPDITHIGRTVMVNGVPITAAHPNFIVRQGGLFSLDKFLPDRKKKKQPYQYISTFGGGIIIFDYPKGGSPGSIGTSAQGECTNVLFGSGKKTFWAVSSVSGASPVYEFEVVSRGPIKTLQGASGDTLVGCAMSTTGDLAATSITNGHVDLFEGANGTPTVLTTPLIEAFYDGFDKSGNLYVDGFNSGGTFGLVELPKGSKSWETLSGASVEFPGNVQFDGKYITVGDQEAHTINGYTCGGTSCTLKRTVSLSGASDCDQTWIAKGYIICPDAGLNNAAIYPYPKGGAALHQLTGPFSAPLGAVQAEK